jgi:hypothetical protein
MPLFGRIKIFWLLSIGVFMVTSSSSKESSNSVSKEIPVWIKGDLPIYLQRNVIATTLIQLFSSEDTNGICVNQTYSRENPLVNLDFSNLVLDFTAFHTQVIDKTPFCSNIFNNSKFSRTVLSDAPAAIDTR